MKRGENGVQGRGGSLFVSGAAWVVGSSQRWSYYFVEGLDYEDLAELLRDYSNKVAQLG